MLVHTESWTKMGVFPTNILEDPSVSMGAKGLYFLIYQCNDKIYSLQDLCDKFTSTTKEDAEKYYYELVEAGYIETRVNKNTKEEKITLCRQAKPKKKMSDEEKDKVNAVTEVVNEKPKNKYEILMNHINRWELPENVKALLEVYFVRWLHKKEGFAFKPDLHTETVNRLIGNLVAMHLDEKSMLEVIQRSIDKCWCTFVEPKAPVEKPQGLGSGFSAENIQSASFTPEEMEYIRKKREELGVDDNE